MRRGVVLRTMLLMIGFIIATAIKPRRSLHVLWHGWPFPGLSHQDQFFLNRVPVPRLGAREQLRKSPCASSFPVSLWEMDPHRVGNLVTVHRAQD